MKGDSEKWARIAAKKPEIQLPSLDLEKIKGLLVGRMLTRDWLINADETAHQISFSKNLGDQAKLKLVRVQFAFAADEAARSTSVTFTLLGNKEEITQTAAVHVKGEMFDVLDAVAVRLP